MARVAAGLDPTKPGSGYDKEETGNDGEVCASREAAVNLKTVLTWAAVAFAIWWVIQQPDSAAHLVHNIGTLLTTAASGISHFIASI
jgi:hypothetical protein